MSVQKEYDKMEQKSTNLFGRARREPPFSGTTRVCECGREFPATTDNERTECVRCLIAREEAEEKGIESA